MVGLVGAALVYVLSLRERQRQQYVECRLRVIAEMNHHIRNALQVITFYTHKGQKQEVGIVEAVERIQWALREVLPQLPEQPTAKAKQDVRVFDIEKFRASHCGSLN
jgi:1,2-phenylacetyl-CoA epoxidase catalytic subunit